MENEGISNNLVIFQHPMFGSARKDRWVCLIGGWEISGDNLDKLRERAIAILEAEVKRLKNISA